MSAVTRVPAGFESADIGYHPMPVEFEYEIDTFWFPDFHPQNRGLDLCPEELENRLCPVIQPKVSVEAYINAIPEQPETPWVADKATLQEPSERALENYPFLARYVVPEMSAEEMTDLLVLPYLTHVDDEFIKMPMYQMWGGMDGFDELEALDVGTYDAVWQYREKAVELLRLRHMIYQMAPHLYQMGWWFGATPQQLQMMFADWYVEMKQLGNVDGTNLDAERMAMAARTAEGGQTKKPMAIANMPVQAGNPEDL